MVVKISEHLPLLPYSEEQASPSLDQVAAFYSNSAVHHCRDGNLAIDYIKQIDHMQDKEKNNIKIAAKENDS